MGFCIFTSLFTKISWLLFEASWLAWLQVLGAPSRNSASPSVGGYRNIRPEPNFVALARSTPSRFIGSGRQDVSRVGGMWQAYVYLHNNGADLWIAVAFVSTLNTRHMAGNKTWRLREVCDCTSIPDWHLLLTCVSPWVNNMVSGRAPCFRSSGKLLFLDMAT